MENTKYNAIEKPKIITVSELLTNYKLRIPEYQRPYKWSTKSVFTLWQDIQTAILNKQNYENFKYRLGSVILHNNCDTNTYDIVDGQQRVTTLLLILKAFDEKGIFILKENNQYSIKYDKSLSNNYNKKVEFCTNILAVECTEGNDSPINEISEKHQKLILEYIKKKWFLDDSEDNIHYLAKVLQSFFSTLEVVVITTNNIDEAFQLFDSQNSRGKSLYAHDLLKPYHLRTMPTKSKQTYRVVKNWEEINEVKIHDLYNNYLFPILNWSKKQNTHYFAAKDIGFYKGISAKETNTLANRIKNASSNFIINEPFMEGKDFFDMTNYYLDMCHDINYTINNGDGIFEQIRKIVSTVKKAREYKENELNIENIQIEENAIKEFDIEKELSGFSKGFYYAFQLFQCALLFYYNKFSNFDATAVKNMFIWAMNIRVNHSSLSKSAVNKHAISENIDIDVEDEEDFKSTMFYEIANAHSHVNISSLTINVKEKQTPSYTKVKNEIEALHSTLQKL